MAEPAATRCAVHSLVDPLDETYRHDRIGRVARGLKIGGTHDLRVMECRLCTSGLAAGERETQPGPRVRIARVRSDLFEVAGLRSLALSPDEIDIWLRHVARPGH